MQLKVSTDYAIRIVLHLAVKGGAATSSEISGQMGIPQSVIATLAKPLQKAGILTTQRGTGGGFALGRAGADLAARDRQSGGGHDADQPLPGAGRLLLPQWRGDLPGP